MRIHLIIYIRYIYIFYIYIYTHIYIYMYIYTSIFIFFQEKKRRSSSKNFKKIYEIKWILDWQSMDPWQRNPFWLALMRDSDFLQWKLIVLYKEEKEDAFSVAIGNTTSRSSSSRTQKPRVSGPAAIPKAFENRYNAQQKILQVSSIISFESSLC